MKNRYVDAILIGLCWLFAVVGIVGSASGVEKDFVVFLAIILSAAVFIVSLLLIAFRHRRQRAIFPVLIVPVVCLAIIISVAATHWPLRVAYALSRDSFDAVAVRIRAGEQIPTPMRAGLFTIRNAGLSPHGIVCLWIHPNLGGSTGFVQCRRDHVPFNLFSIVRLDDRWQFISED